MHKKNIVSDRHNNIKSNFKSIYKYRSLIYTFALRDIKLQYAQTLLGIVWSIIKPLTGLLIFTLFFDKLLKIDTGDIPYPLFAFIGIISWYYFSYLIQQGGTSVMQEQNLIKKIYFPKLILPISKALAGLVEFSISLILLFVMMLLWGYIPSFRIVFFPVFIILNIIAGLSIGIWLSALTVRYRDFHHIIPYLVSFGIFITPVFYPTTLIPQQYHFLIYLNPMAGVIEGFRWTLLREAAPSLWFLISFIPMILLFFSGLYYFTKIEGKMADII
jgi:lipopolysaccharide transport system permease protein